MNIDDVPDALTPDIYQKFRDAIAIGKWANGQPLTEQQKATCIQAIIAYEHKNLPEHERTGYVPPKKEPCGNSQDESIQPVQWK